MPPLSWNEIKDRALAFSREWAKESSEDAEAKSFWDQFFNVFGVPRRRVATFETPVTKQDGHQGYNHYFRLTAGNTQINASDLRKLPLPPLNLIIQLGQAVMVGNTLAIVDAAVSRILDIRSDSSLVA
jgi:hypothetical protein